MHDNLIRRNEKLAKSLIAALGSRNMTGYYAATKEEALQIALSLIPPKSTVTNGGSLSIKEIGLVDAVRAWDYEYCDKYTAEDPRRAELTAYDSDVYMGSVNAITSDGILVNIDGNANRVSAYAYGPRKLVLIVGMNKVAPDVDSALKRARSSQSIHNPETDVVSGSIIFIANISESCNKEFHLVFCFFFLVVLRE